MPIEKFAFDEEIWRPVLAKTKGTCTYCGTPLNAAAYGQCDSDPPNGAWEVDHWVPKSWFRDETRADVYINLWPACCKCNDDKSDRIDGERYLIERALNNHMTNQLSLDRLVSALSLKRQRSG